MIDLTRVRPRRGTIALGMFFAATLLLRMAAIVQVPLIPEEAYYWMYAGHTQWAYFDHPPMVAWTIALGTAIFGHTELGVRLGAHLLAWGAGVAMYHLGAAWCGRRAGLIAAGMIHLLPVYFGLGFIATMDSALLFFWVAALLGLTAALKRGEASGWYVFGVMTGLAFLSKYSAIFLPVGAAVAVVGRPAWRGHLRTMHPYLGMALAAAVTLPVILWNQQNNWASFRFQFVDRYAQDTFSLRSFAVFWVMQLAILTPMLLAAVVMAGGRDLRRPRSARRWIAWSFFLPATAVVLFKSLKSEVHINWMAPIYLSLLPLLARTGLARLRLERRLAARWRWGPGLRATAAVCVGINLVMLGYLLLMQPRMRWWGAFGPWDTLARVVEHYEDDLEARTGREPIVIADGKYRLASVLAFYRLRYCGDADHPEARLFTTSQWVVEGEGLGYEYWLKREDLVGSDVVYVTDDQRFLPQIEPWFESVRIVRDPRLNEQGGHYSLVICRGLRASRGGTATEATMGTDG